MPVAMKSYFMTQAIAARYTQSTADEIRYFDASGAALDTSAAVRDGAIARRQVYVRYANGTHVLVRWARECAVPRDGRVVEDRHVRRAPGLMAPDGWRLFAFVLSRHSRAVRP